jgi:hypothetical protein
MPSLSATTWTLVSLAAVLALGLVVLVRARLKAAAHLAFTEEYRQKVHALVEQADGGSYEWLTLNANRMQIQMGRQGVITFKPPFANYMVRDYPVVLNVLGELRKCLSDSLLSRNLLHQYHALLDDALLRYQGTLVERDREAAAAVRNPFAWFSVGARTLLSAPLWFLAELGIIPRSFASRVTASRTYRVLSGLVAGIGFVSAVVGLVTGWEQFAVILRKVVPGAF